MKESKGHTFFFLQWFTLVISLACAVCLIHVQWTMYSHRKQIDYLMKQIKECKDEREQQKETEPQLKDIHDRIKRSNHGQGVPSIDSNHSSATATDEHKIRKEITRQIEKIIRTHTCAKKEKMCLRGPRGRRGRRGPRGLRGQRGPKGPMGPQGPVGKHGPQGLPCVRCNITLENLPDLRGPPGLAGPPGPRGQKGEQGIHVSPARITIPPRTVIVNESDMVSFYCGAKGYPVPQITWIKVNGSLPKGRYQSDQNGGLLIRNATKTDEGTYKCTATNIFPGEAVAFANLIVQDEANIVNKPVSVITEEGRNVTFTCLATGTPTPKITWSKAFYSLPVGRHKISQEFVIARQQTNGHFLRNKVVLSNLTLMNLISTDNGVYMCEATNKMSTNKATGQLTVLRALSFTVLPPARIEATVGDRVLIHCAAANAMRLNWKENQKSVNVVELKNGTLEFKNITVKDQGNYTCIARNVYREITAMVELLVEQKEWQRDFSPYFCGSYRRLVKKHVSKEECKSLCTGGCQAVEWWETGCKACYICTDASKRKLYHDTGDTCYPPHVLIKRES